MATTPPPPYPHVSEIQDWPTQRSVKLLWDQIAALKSSVAGNTETLTTHDASLTILAKGVASAAALAAGAQPLSTPTASTPPVSLGGTPPGNPTPAPPSSDGGMGEAGCTAAGANGHVPPGSPLTPFTVGQIVCGVAKEFPALFAVAPDQATLDSWRVCFNGRVIWHLNLAGFQASHYPGANGSTYLILVNIPMSGAPNNQYAYRITNYDPTLQLTAQMIFAGITPGASTAPDGGIADGVTCP